MLEKQAALHLYARILPLQSRYWVDPRANGLGAQVPMNPALWARQSASDTQLVDSSARRQGAAEAVKDEKSVLACSTTGLGDLSGTCA